MSEPSLKRLAWRFGCAATGSLEEKRARKVLIERILRDHLAVDRLARPGDKVTCARCGTRYVPDERHGCAAKGDAYRQAAEVFEHERNEQAKARREAEARADRLAGEARSLRERLEKCEFGLARARAHAEAVETRLERALGGDPYA